MQLHKMRDEELLEGCKRGDQRAQKQLFDRFAGKMMGVCLRYVSNNHEATDVLQDGFIKVFQKLDTFKLEGSLEGWIRRIMVNTALDYLRKNKELRHAASTDDVEHLLLDDSYILENLNAEQLLKLLQHIPDGYRTVFNLFAIEGYSHKEIADELGISVNTSKSQYSRARDFIQKTLEKQKAI